MGIFTTIKSKINHAMDGFQSMKEASKMLFEMNGASELPEGKRTN